MNGSKAAKQATLFKYTMAGPVRRWLYRKLNVPLPEVRLPDYIAVEYRPGAAQ